MASRVHVGHRDHLLPASWGPRLRRGWTLASCAGRLVPHSATVALRGAIVIAQGSPSGNDDVTWQRNGCDRRHVRSSPTDRVVAMLAWPTGGDAWTALHGSVSPVARRGPGDTVLGRVSKPPVSTPIIPPVSMAPKPPPERAGPAHRPTSHRGCREPGAKSTRGPWPVLVWPRSQVRQSSLRCK